MMHVLQKAPTQHRRNFFTEDDFFQKLLEKHLDEDLYAYAYEELKKFGDSCANHIDERAAHTDREGQQGYFVIINMEKRFRRYG